MFDELVRVADLSEYTDEEIIKAQELHEEDCVGGCRYGAFSSIFDPYGWLNMARRILEDRPRQKETLF